MDRYKFRGKHVSLIDKFNSGAWVYGYLSAPNYINSGELSGEMLVDPATVGQYTGLNDKNGKEIYEGDLLQDEFGVGEVEWVQEHCAYMVFSRNPSKYHYLENDGQLNSSEVIGNKIDNPELLEG